MNKTFSTVAVFLLSGVAQVASADHFDGNINSDRDMASGRYDWDRDQDHQHSSTAAAPEISPDSLIAALSLLGGALLVLRGRSNLKPTS
jgi:hypothetical protein